MNDVAWVRRERKRGYISDSMSGALFAAEQFHIAHALINEGGRGVESKSHFSGRVSLDEGSVTPT